MSESASFEHNIICSIMNCLLFTEASGSGATGYIVGYTYSIILINKALQLVQLFPFLVSEVDNRERMPEAEHEMGILVMEGLTLILSGNNSNAGRLHKLFIT